MFDLNQTIDIIRDSGLMDADWYLEKYPDVAAAGVSPLLHYVLIGGKLKRNPSPRFDTAYYLKTNPDVGASTMNPLLHYIIHGQKEGRPAMQPGTNDAQPQLRTGAIQVNIVSYRYGHIAAQAIESVLAQTRKPERIVLIDDGVGDCVYLEPLYPEVEFVIRERNLGIVQNFNQALRETVCERVLFLGADNWLRPDTLEKLSAQDADIVSYDIAITGAGAKVFAGQRQCHEECGYHLWQFAPGDLTKANYIHGSSLFNTMLALSVGGYAASGSAVASEEDWVLWQRMVRSGATHHHVPEAMLYYRRHAHNFQKY